jgi:hypothetical protein
MWILTYLAYPSKGYLSGNHKAGAKQESVGISGFCATGVKGLM